MKVLGQLREGGKIVNYHTKNGMIYARDSRDKKYVLIEPWLSEDEVYLPGLLTWLGSLRLVVLGKRAGKEGQEPCLTRHASSNMLYSLAT